MIHKFESYFPLEDEYVVDSCRNIRDELILFNGAGEIVISRVGDPALCGVRNFFSLLNAGEVAFFRRCSWGRGKNPALLLTSRGAVLIFGHLFPTSGIFAAVLFHEAPEAVRAVFAGGYFRSVMMSDGILGAEGEASANDVNAVVKTAELAMDAFYFSGDESPEGLALHICTLARFVGCHVKCIARIGGALSDIFVFSVSSFIASMLYLLLEARVGAEDRCDEVYIGEKDGRIWMDCRMQVSAPRPLLFLDSLCEKKGFPFDIFHENGGQRVSFSPEICDVALLGLKNRFIFE